MCQKCHGNAVQTQRPLGARHGQNLNQKLTNLEILSLAMILTSFSSIHINMLFIYFIQNSSNKIKMDNKFQNSKSLQLFSPNKKCTNLPSCNCLICKKQSEIIHILQTKQQLQWFGKKKPTSRFTKEIQQELLKIQKRDPKKNKKNESQNFDVSKQHLDCNSSYLKNYDKKPTQKTIICQPQNQLGFDRNNFQSHNTLYNETFKHLKNLKLQKQKPCKRLEGKFDLPFIGKSSYHEQFTRLESQRVDLIKPKDKIRTIELDSKLENEYNTSMKRIKSKDLGMYRPPSPMKPKGHMMKSNSFASAYNTFYKNTFGKQVEGEMISNEPNPEFLRRSKYGSLSKTRWMTKGKTEHLRRDESLQMYK